MNILIYGAGAIGSFIGGHLALAGHDVTLLGRAPLAEAVQTRGLRLALANGEQHELRQGVRAATSLAEAVGGGGRYDWIAFTMKAYDTIPALHDILANIPEPPPVVSFQNGVGNEDTIAEALGRERAVAATVTTPVSVVEPGSVVEEKQRGVALAIDCPAAAAVLESLNATALTVDTVDDRDSLKWSKLLLNMTANALPAILDMLPAEVFSEPDLFNIEWAALREALWVMEMRGVRLINLPGAPARTLGLAAQSIPRPLLRPLLKWQVAGGRGDKLPSLLGAMRAGRRRTEVAWLNGAVAQAAKSKNRLAPINHVLALTLSDIAAGRVPWDVYHHNPEMLFTALRIAQRPAGLDRED